jgi:VanZ family protein
MFHNSRLVRILLKLPVFMVAAGIWFLSSQSALPRIKGIFGFDKLQHLLAYTVLAAAAGLWVSPDRWKKQGARFLFLIAGIAALYGLSDEIHQSFVPGRDASVWDWIADTLGAFAGTGLTAAVIRHFAYKTHQQ